MECTNLRKNLGREGQLWGSGQKSLDSKFVFLQLDQTFGVFSFKNFYLL
jgi:hypothetical protein